MEMKSYFWFGISIDDFLFKDFNVSTWAGMLGLCIGSSFLSFLVVAITFFKEMLHHKLSSQQQGQAIVAIAHSQLFQVWTSPFPVHMLQTMMSFLQITLGYFLMLIVMSFNAYLVFSVLFGSVLGFFLLNPFLLTKRNINNPRILTQIQCHEEECGSLINDQEQVGSIVASNSPSSQHDFDKEISVSATIH